MISAAEVKAMETLVARLTTTYPNVSPEHVADVVHGAHAQFADRPLREFVPLFVERRAKRELDLLGR